MKKYIAALLGSLLTFNIVNADDMPYTGEDKTKKAKIVDSKESYDGEVTYSKFPDNSSCIRVLAIKNPTYTKKGPTEYVSGDMYELNITDAGDDGIVDLVTRNFLQKNGQQWNPVMPNMVRQYMTDYGLRYFDELYKRIKDGLENQDNILTIDIDVKDIFEHIEKYDRFK